MAEKSVTTVHIDLSRLENKIDNLSSATAAINNNMAAANEKIEQVNQELLELKNDFETMILEQRKTAAIQQAATELIRVRQELEQDYGGYKVVRETMLGVLQATDLALVKKTTISRVSEELMLSTPRYWLAPCLVAVSAWIGNDRDLANRAIAEAVKRDEERTALAMALICRRNNRTDTCYEWLSLYFAKQDATKFSEGNFTYLNAYLNGVFGPDKKHMCDDYIAKWMKEIQSNAADFEAQQVELWKEYCKNFTVDIDRLLPDMSGAVHEYAEIKDYIGRIHAVEPIAQKFTGMKNAIVDQDKLKKEIDSTLVNLISKYDSEEEPLRKEERYLNAVKYFEGDSTAAKRAILEADKNRKDETIDLVSQMTNVITKKENAFPSEKKTAVSFLSSYIRTGFNEYINDSKASFPSEITIEVDNWIGKTGDGTNRVEMLNDYEHYMNAVRSAKIQEEQKNQKTGFPISSIVLGVLGLLLIVPVPPVGIVLLIIAAVNWFRVQNKNKTSIANVARLNAEYDGKIVAGKQVINNVTDQWIKSKEAVAQFESKPLKEIIA